MARLLSASLVLFLSVSALAQAGSVDLGFAPQDMTGGTNDGLNGSCRAIAVQPDGKVLVGGDFTHANGMERGRIARLNADGSLDELFRSRDTVPMAACARWPCSPMVISSSAGHLLT